MLTQDWAPNAHQAAQIGLVSEVTAHEQLLPRAQALAEEWIRSGRRQSRIREQGRVAELQDVNKREVDELADAFFAEK